MIAKLKLRILEDNDIALFKKWVYQDYIAKWYQQPLDWIDEIENRKGKFNWIHHLIVMFDEKDIGFCQFYEYKKGGENWHGEIELEGTYSIDYMIGDRDFLNKGLGIDIVKSLIKAIDAMPNAKRIIAQPEPNNMASCRTLLSAGFIYDTKNQLYIISL